MARDMVKMSSGKGVRKPLAAVGVVLADIVAVACITATVAESAIRIAKKAAKVEALLESSDNPISVAAHYLPLFATVLATCSLLFVA